MAKSRKIFFVCSFLTLFVWYSILFPTKTTTILMERAIGTELAKTNPYSKMKYILQWTNSFTEPFIFMGRGQNTFIKRRCYVNNCFITSDKNLLSDLRDFDAVLFHGPEISKKLIPLPPKRSKRQKYVFVSMESPKTYPLIYYVYNNYFNWTMTYKLSSDIYFGCVIIKNKQGDIIGPKEDMHWLSVEDMEPITNELKEKLNSKTIAAAWFVSHCKVSSKRGKIAESLQNELNKYNMTIDIYGACGPKYCPRYRMRTCLKILERDYYFYLAFENAISEDYVTEKLLHAVQHNTVPIVLGGANYSSYMPNGSYLYIEEPHNMKGLAKQMVEIIYDKQKYYDFFRWTKYYSYHYGEEQPETDYYCDLCRKINDVNLVNQTSIHSNIVDWWNGNQNLSNMR